MTACTESILIEIAQRRRALEDAIEAADKILEGKQKYHESVAREYADSVDFDGRRLLHSANESASDIEDLRFSLEQKAEACRDDMQLLAEIVRKGWENAKS